MASNAPAARRASGSAPVDVFTGLAVAGTLALLIAAGILWVRGGDMASPAGQSGTLPFTIMQN